MAIKRSNIKKYSDSYILYLKIFLVIYPMFLFSNIYAIENNTSTNLLPGQLNILYYPSSIKTGAKNSFEIKQIESFFKKRLRIEDPVVSSIDSSYIYIAIEPFVVSEELSKKCANQEGFSSKDLAILRENISSVKMNLARDDLKAIYLKLECSQKEIQKKELAEVILWSSFLHQNQEHITAKQYLRQALYLDPLIEQNLEIYNILTDSQKDRIKDLLNTVKTNPEQELLDIHIPTEDQGNLWSKDNILIDGRRLTFEKLFLKLHEGIHFFQTTLSDGRKWGSFFYVESGKEMYDIADLVRFSSNIKKRYFEYFDQLIFTGKTEESFLKALKFYTLKINQQKIYLSAIGSEKEKYISVRVFDVDKGLSLPTQSWIPGRPKLKDKEILSTDKKFFIDMMGSYSILLTGPGKEKGKTTLSFLGTDYNKIADYQSNAGNVFFRLGYARSFFQIGAFLSLGARNFQLIDSTDQIPTSHLSFDSKLGLDFAFKIAFAKNMSLLPSVGYITNISSLRGLPVYCNEPSSESLDYACVGGFPTDTSSSLFRANARSRANGVRLAVALNSPFLKKNNYTFRLHIETGYSLFIYKLKQNINIDQKYYEQTKSQNDIYSLYLDKNSLGGVLQGLDFSLGLRMEY